MNLFEQKFKKELADCQRIIKSRDSDIAEIDSMNEQYRGKISSMTSTSTIIEDSAVKEAIAASIIEHDRKIRANNERKEQLITWQRQSSIKLSVLRQICPHESSKLLYTHPHNNDDVYECNLCGATC